MTEHKSKLEAVGFIGLGIMGLPMVRNLLKEGIEVLAYDLNQASLDAAIADGAKVATSAQVVAQEKGIIITCLLYTSPSPRDGLLSRMPSSA